MPRETSALCREKNEMHAHLECGKRQDIGGLVLASVLSIQNLHGAIADKVDAQVELLQVREAHDGLRLPVQQLEIESRQKSLVAVEKQHAHLRSG